MFSHSLISIILLRKWVTHLLIHLSNIHHCLICISHVKDNDVEISKPGFPSKYLRLREGPCPRGRRHAGVQRSVLGGQAFPCAARHAIPRMCFPSPPGSATSCWCWRVSVTNIRDFSIREQPRSTFALGLLPAGLRQGIVEGAPPGWESLKHSVEAGALCPNHKTPSTPAGALSPLVFEPSGLRGHLALRQPAQTT